MMSFILKVLSKCKRIQVFSRSFICFLFLLSALTIDASTQDDVDYAIILEIKGAIGPTAVEYIRDGLTIYCGIKKGNTSGIANGYTRWS